MKARRSRTRRRQRSPLQRKEESKAFFKPSQKSVETKETKPDPLQGHNLTSSPIMGEPTLEKAFDGKARVRHGDKGSKVTQLQKALIQLGYPLPQFGPDGSFGNETSKALKTYQADTGLTSDGIAGRDTLAAMDVDLRHGSPQIDPDQAENDTEVTEKFKENKALKPEFEPKSLPSIYFLQGSADLDAEETKKLKEFAAKFHKHASIKLRGFASDEGSNAVNKALAHQRMNNVKAILEQHYQGKIELDPDAWKVGQDNVNFAQMRSVKLVPEGMGNLDFDHVVEDGETERPCLGNENPDHDNPTLEAAFQTAVDEAIKMVNIAIPTLSPIKKPAHQKLFDAIFDPGDNQKLVQSQVAVRLAFIRDHLDNLKAADKHFCGTSADDICQSGSPAYNTDPAKDNPPGVLTLCRGFMNYPTSMHPVILIHEAHHGMPGFFSRDEAYTTTRLITLLDTKRALQNAGSFELYVRLVNRPGEIPLNPAEKDSFGSEFDPTKQQLLVESLAWPQQWFRRTRHLLSAAYKHLVLERKERGSGFDKGPVTEFVDFLINNFGLTPSYARPSMQDLEIVAALFDRVVRINNALELPLNWQSSQGNPSHWERGPGTDVFISDQFLNQPLDARMTILLQELINATADISDNVSSNYVSMVYFIRNLLNLGPG